MDYKKKYKELVGKIEKAYLYAQTDSTKAVLEEIRPELKSEDERIRKALIDFFNKGAKNGEQTNGVYDKDILDWLEKQGEKEVRQKFLEDLLVADDIYQMSVNDAMVEEAKNKAIEALSKLEISKLLGLEKQDNTPKEVTCTQEVEVGNGNLKALVTEKITIDKVEPKFCEGEWLCESEPNNYARFIQILEIVNVQGKEGYRISRDIHNDEDIVEVDFVEKYYHKFDIKDAKDGDVLFEDKISSLPSPFIVIFKTKDSVNTFSSHCFIGFDGNFYKGEGEHYPENLHPATKEQRDLLFQKMKEAGYEWDAKKKELKKIEQSIDIPFGAKDSELQEVSYYIPEGFHAEIDGNKVVIKKGEQKPAWSEEDKNFMYETLSNLTELKDRYGEGHGNVGNCIDWLRTIKDKAQSLSQPKEWSEEDEKMYLSIMSVLLSTIGTDKTGLTGFTVTREINWLKSLKERIGG